jgi:hypothetical protein
MEINTLPGLNPTISDIVLAAKGEGVAYETMVQEICGRRCGATAWKVPPDPGLPARGTRFGIACFSLLRIRSSCGGAIV